MRRLNLVLLASLQLARARQPGFSIHDDLLAHPQFEVVFSEDFISETDALAILDSSRTRGATHAADASQSDLTKARESAAPADVAGTKIGSHDDNDDDAPIAETYEFINSEPWRYLCSVPVIAPPPALNRTATELAKAEEARELSRASAKGWELMSALDGQCLYFMSGWWSYSFCYGKTVVQFHAVAGRPGEAPTPEDNSLEYVLGRAQKPSDSTANHDQDDQPKSLPPPNGQLQVKGDQRYLSQRLEDGTLCDLTGRPRTIEIQYHCSPDTTADRIGWVKEVTTCTYLMVVYTPRLCSDVAFHPPKETRAHPIRCRQILSSEEEENTWRYNKMVAAGELLGQKPKSAKAVPPTFGKDVPPNYFVGTNVGGVTIGAKKHVTDQYADKLPLARGVSRHGAGAAKVAGATGTGIGTVVEVLASKKKDAAETEALSDEELEQMNLDPKTVGEFREEMERLAGARGWKLQVMDVPGEGLEYLGAFDDEEGEVQDAAGGGEQGKEGKQGKQEKEGLKKGGKVAKRAKEPKGEEKVGGEKGKAGGKDKGAEKKGQEGSEEAFFKEEL